MLIRLIIAIIQLHAVFAQFRQSPSIVYSTPLNCTDNNYFNSAELRCVSCQNATVPSRDRLQCVCPSNSRTVSVTPRGPQCEACGANEVLSSDGSSCVSCRGGNCRCETDTEVLRNGTCQVCQNDTIPDESGLNCIPCTRLDCLCQTNSSSCGSPLSVPNVMDEIELSGRNRYHSTMLARRIRPAAQLCAAGSQQYCSELVNYCVLQNFDRTASSACSIFDEARRFVNNWQNTWDPLFYNSDADSELGKEVAINQIYKLHDGQFSKLDILLAVYNLNGTLNRLSPWRDSQAQLCPDPYQSEMLTFGRRYKMTCTLSRSDILAKDEQLFYEAYVRYRDEQTAQEKLYAIPIVNRALKMNDRSTNLGPREANQWVLTRRFFVVDGYSLTMDNGTRLAVRYANALHLHVQLQPTRDGRIYPPYLVIDYNEILLNEENMVQRAVMQISYESNPSKHDRDLEITMAVLCPLSVIWAALCAYSWGRRAGRQTAIDISSIIQFLFFECSILADVFFTVIFCMSAWIVFGYKEQTYFFYNLLNENQEHTILIYLVIALGLKFIALLHNNVMLILQETFFIDWEKPKIALASKSRALTADIEKDKIEQPPVIWRTYMIANEWNELQQYRKTSIALQLVLLFFFYEFLGFKFYAVAEPGYTNYEPTKGYETCLLTKLAILFPLYLLIGFTQWIIQVIVVERFLADRFHNFIDLCSVANISVLSLTHPLHGYYIHGRSVHGMADTGMSQMNDFLQRERDNLCGHRGLDVSTPDLQTFYVNLPQSFRKRYDDIFAMSRQFASSTATAGISRSDAATTRVAGLVQVHAEMNSFLQSFIEHSQPGTDYLIRDRTLIEALLDLEVTVTTQTGNFLRDPSEVAFSRCFVYGNEWAWLSFESLLFVVSYILFDSIHLSSLLVFVISKSLRAIFSFFSTSHLAKSSLVDHRFLI